MRREPVGPSGLIAGSRIKGEKLEEAIRMRRNPTGAEQVLWDRLRANRLAGFQFRRQQIILGFIVDFYCHVAGLVVEVDGSVHTERVAYDTERTEILEQLGLCVIRFTNQEVINDVQSVTEAIQSAAESRSR